MYLDLKTPTAYRPLSHLCHQIHRRILFPIHCGCIPLAYLPERTPYQQAGWHHCHKFLHAIIIIVEHLYFWTTKKKVHLNWSSPQCREKRSDKWCSTWYPCQSGAIIFSVSYTFLYCFYTNKLQLYVTVSVVHDSVTITVQVCTSVHSIVFLITIMC